MLSKKEVYVGVITCHAGEYFPQISFNSFHISTARLQKPGPGAKPPGAPAALAPAGTGSTAGGEKARTSGFSVQGPVIALIYIFPETSCNCG